MIVGGMHPEDVKAALRKRFRSVAAFERAQGLPAKSVSEIFRGRKSARVSGAIEAALNTPPSSSNDEVSHGAPLITVGERA
jgi:lambda repressor-like predicted transcriptional regulator